MLYNTMHDLPVVKKRMRCAEMAALREKLMADTAFAQLLQTACTLRNHIYSLSRKVRPRSKTMGRGGTS